jgi:uncharacterized protein with beta-barrel porin domain
MPACRRQYYVVADIVHIPVCEIGAWRRHVGRAGAFFASALFVSLLAAAPALADCQPASPVSGQIVTCSGTDNNGFQAGVGVNQLTVNVQTGATVNNIGGIAIGVNDLNTVTNNGAVNAGDDGTGIAAGNNNTITNAATGTITVGDAVNVATFGILVGDNNTVVNLGSIQVGTGCFCGVAGINAGNNNIITNVGPITGGDFAVGILAVDGNTITNSGAITMGLNGLGIGGGNGNTITNTASGIITVGDSAGSGAAGIAVQDNNIVSNLGTIQVGSTPGFGFPASGILGNTGNTITNAGSITGGELAAGIFVLDNNIITNSGRITFGQDSVGISAGDNNTITNTTNGIITVGDAVNFGAFGIVAGSGNTITNLGQIVVGTFACGCLDIAGIAVDTGNTVVNGGTIVGGDNSVGIHARDNNQITNSGAITIGNAVLGDVSGIRADFDNTITVSGTIVVGSGDPLGFTVARGIDVLDGNTITISSTGRITAGDAAVGISAVNDNIITNNGIISVGAGSKGLELGSDNHFTNNGTVRAGALGFSVVACFCDQNNTIVNNGTLDGQISLEGSGHSLTNNGLITVTDPGSPVGTTHFISGSFIQSATGTLALRVDSAGQSDKLGATSVTLGGNLRVVVQPGLYGASTFYAGVVAANDPITTTFAQTTTESAFFTATATYNANSVDLTLNRVPFGSVAGATQNQRNVGNYLEQNYSTSLTGNAAAFFTTLLQSPSLGVLDQLSGAGTTGAQHGAFSAGTMFNTTMMDQVWSWLEGGGGGASDFTPESTLLRYAASDTKRARPEYKAFAAIRPDAGAFRPQQWRAWATAFGGSQSLRGDAVIGSPDAGNRTLGGAGGIDYQVSPQLLLGFGAAGTSTDFSAPGLSTSGRLEAGHLGVYGAYRWGATHVAGTFSYSHFENDTNRTISGVGPTETAKGQFSSDQFGGRLQVGHKFVFDRFAVTPFAAVQYMQLWQHAYTETSTAGGVPGILGLSFQSRTVSSLPTFLGAEVNTRIAMAHGAVWSPFVRASWVHEFMPDRTVAAAMSILPTGTFIVDGPRAARDAARIEAGSNFYVTRNVAFFANFIGEYSGHTSSNAGNGGIRVNW